MSANGDSLARLIHVRRAFEEPGGGAPVVPLRDVCLDIPHGGTVAIVGPSGSGKSTLLNLVGALDRPTAGSVLFDGRDLAGLSSREAARFRARDVGFVFQLHHLLPQLTVLENTLVPALPLGGGRSAEAAESRARELLARVGLAERADDWPARLSGGERQRVALVRAMINRPRLLLADEPTGSLDRAAADAMGELLADCNRAEGTALLVVTHSAALAARMERVYELRDGALGAAADA